MRQLVIRDGWQVKVRQTTGGAQVPALAEDFQGGSDWVAAAVPGGVHEALWRAGRIGSPYEVDALAASAWLADCDVLYRCHFDLPSDFRVDEDDVLRLCCDGLDTVATVWLNQVEILRSDNMFTPQSATLPTRELLRRRDNELWILFESALRVGRAREAQGGRRPVWNGDNSRVYVRKAQYQYGWDFAPTVLGAGPWQPIRLQCYSARIVDVAAPLTVAPDLQTARMALAVTIDVPHDRGQSYEVALTLRAPGGATLLQRRQAVTSQGVAHDVIDIEQPELWWPRGHGEQPMYSLQVCLHEVDSDGTPCDERTLRLGARRLRLVEERLSDGENFYIEMNNRPIFCGGANWIPADVLPTRVSADRYRALLDEAVVGELTMLRVWGGGIYESDVFYDLCDERGLLVWQDFAFACGVYPAHADIASSVAAEARAALRRLRHHPSLVLWAGNNEDYSIAQSVGAYHGPTEPTPEPGPSSLEKPRFDGRALYEQVLATVCAEEDPSRPYWPGSPYSRTAADPNAGGEGDRHIWDVWHGGMRDYQEYGAIPSRFASEFGMQAVPDMDTARRALSPAAVDESTLPRMNYGQDGPGRIRKYVDRNLPALPHGGVEGYVYLTQVNQAEAMAYAVRSFRRGFDANHRTSGALVWQFDDCWPSVSWSMMSFCQEGEPPRRKPSFYAVRRELLPWAVGLATTASPHSIALWVCAPPLPADGLACTQATLLLRAFHPDGRPLLRDERQVTVVSNQSLEVGTWDLPTDAGPLIVGAQLCVNAEDGEQVVARSVLWPQPLHTLSNGADGPLADPGLSISRGFDHVEIRVARPAKAVLLEVDGAPALPFSDNLVDLLPDEPLTVEAPGLGALPLVVRSLFGGRICL